MYCCVAVNAVEAAVPPGGLPAAVVFRRPVPAGYHNVEMISKTH
jgi:hypothetical protein